MLSLGMGHQLLRRFAREQEGSLTIFAVFMVTFILIFTALSANSVYLMRQRLGFQSMADSIAHAAIVDIDKHSITNRHTGARAFEHAAQILPPSQVGVALKSTDLVFGDWDQKTQVFTPNPDSEQAVRVSLTFNKARGNAMPGFAFRDFLESDTDMTLTSIAEAYKPECLRNGIVANQHIKVGDSNQFGPNFCVHSKGTFFVGTGNNFQPQAGASLPKLSDLSGDIGANPGMEEALQEKALKLRILTMMEEIYEDFLSPSRNKYTPSYITDEEVLYTIRDRKMKPGDFTPGRIHYFRCNNGKAIAMERGKYQNMILISPNCNFKFGGGTAFRNAMIVTLNGWPRSFFSRNGLTVGLNDGCATGGGAVLMARGGFYVSSGVNIYGSQVIAGRGIFFEKNNQNIRGGSIIAGASINLGSGSKFYACSGTGTDDLLEVDAFRLVQ